MFKVDFEYNFLRISQNNVDNGATCLYNKDVASLATYGGEKMNNVKNIILTYMAAHNLKQQDMADKLNISRQSFNYKLNGKIAFSDKEKIVIAKLIGEDVGTIFFNPKVAAKATIVALQ